MHVARSANATAEEACERFGEVRAAGLGARIEGRLCSIVVDDLLWKYRGQHHTLENEFPSYCLLCYAPEV